MERGARAAARSASGVVARSAAPWPGLSLAAWLEADRDRLILWSPVALGAGAALYLSLTSEPAIWVGPALAVLGLAAAAPARLALTWRCLFAAMGLMGAGLALTQGAAWRAAAPVIARPYDGVLIEGLLVKVVPLERGGARLILEPRHIDRAPEPWPARIRVNVRAVPDDLAPGDAVRLRASLMPPPKPMAPGAYDVARALWFQRVGAVGFTFGAAARIDAGAAPSNADATDWGQGAGLAVARLRHLVSTRIQAALPGATGGVANALLTGVKGHIPKETVEALRDAGLAHLLVVAGMHMGFVSGIVFLVIRGGLALAPPIALRHPVKKWAAAATLVVCFLYLIMTGAAPPTRRAFVMILVVMTAIMLDRRALSMRLLALAAWVVLILAPDAVMSPGFQMSFAAVAALIAVYEERLADALPRLGPRGLGGMADHVLAIGLTTIIASAATEPFAAYHFDHIALYSIPANMIAVPITAFWSMPWGLAALAAMPFGAEGPFLTAMGWGIDLVILVATRVTTWPAAIIMVPAMPASALAAIALGLAWLCLWRCAWRWAGLVPILGAFGLWALAPRPDLLVDGAAKTLAVRGADGHLKFAPGRPKRAAIENWLERDGDGDIARALGLSMGQPAPGAPDRRDLDLAGPGDGMGCDALGCVWRAPDGTRVAWARRAGALAEDCLAADVVITRLRVWRCPAARVLIDHKVLEREGGQALRFEPDGIARIAAVPEGTDRPWAPANRPGPPAPVLNAPASDAPPSGLAAEPVLTDQPTSEQPGAEAGRPDEPGASDGPEAPPREGGDDPAAPAANAPLAPAGRQ